MKKRLGDLIRPAKIVRAKSLPLPVLSVTRHNGLVQQDTVFNKQIASRDTSKYLVVSPNQLVVGIHIDEGALAFSNSSQRGVVSPAYRLWDIREPDEVFSPYLNRLIRSPATVDYFASHYRQTAHRRGKIRSEDFLALPVFVPPLPEQKRIAAILDAADAFRAKRRESIEQLDSLIQATFLEMFGDPVTNPKGWAMATLPDGATVFTDGPFGSNLKSSHYSVDGVRVIRLQNIGVGQLLDDDRAYITEEHFESLPRNHCVPGDVVIGTLGDPNLRACVIPPTLARSLNKADCILLRPNARLLHAAYACWLLNTPSLVSKALELVRGQTRGRISMGRLKTLPVPLPPIPLQSHFASMVESIEQQKARLKAHLAELDTLFASLQSRAFNGELVA